MAHTFCNSTQLSVPQPACVLLEHVLALTQEVKNKIAEQNSQLATLMLSIAEHCTT
jgi:hypothetical protein